MSFEPIDLMLDGLPGVVSSYVRTGGEPAVVDPGPSTTLDRLKEGLGEHGVGTEDLRHLILTHVHLDHAGATGHLVEGNPDLVVHVHDDAVEHLVDPSRLVASTRRSFADDHDRLWGEVLPVPEDNIEGWDPESDAPVADLMAISTPGHIDHHVAYLDEGEGTLLAGDALGVILSEGAPTHPPTPIPSLDLRAWDRTLQSLEGLGPDRIAVGHFGFHGGFESRRREIRARLQILEIRVRRAMERGDEVAGHRYAKEVVEVLRHHVPGPGAKNYFGVFDASLDWRGAEFYLERHPPE